MNKLVYKRYKENSSILTIGLHNGYTIIAIKSWDKEKNIYNVELRLKENTSEKWDLIEKAGNLVFNTDSRHINSVVLRQVSTYFQEGYFDYYINRSKYEMECFDKGNDLYEMEISRRKRGYSKKGTGKEVVRHL